MVAAENRPWYEGADLAACAAACAYHLTQAHAFVEGNKRLGGRRHGSVPRGQWALPGGHRR